MNGFADAKPFPHIVLQDWWNPPTLRDIVAEFPAPDDPRWQTYPLQREIGKKAGGPHMWGQHTRNWFATVASEDFIEWLTDLTGIPDLTADTLGGGMHLTGEGGRLGLHTDFNRHPDPRMDGRKRRLNLLLFLNLEWEREWGGTLYLGANREVAILPLFNRMVIFETSATSWHGHPEPIVGNHVRRSLACYYWGPARREEPLQHTTVWQE